MTIQTVTVIGANGTMGTNVAALIAAFSGARVYMVSREIKKSEEAIERAVSSVRADCIRNRLIPADYDMLPACLGKSDFVFESIAERAEVKQDVLTRFGHFIRSDAVIGTGTSGLSVTKLSECLPEALRSRFFGVHFFNPPYSMLLCELIPTSYSNPVLQQALHDWLCKVLMRKVVEVKDAPAFLANRVGLQFTNRALQLAKKYADRGGIDYIDAVLSTCTGRAMSPLATTDFIGLDVHKAVVDNVRQNTADYANDTFILPDYIQTLITQGSLGRKAGCGLFRSEMDDSGKKHSMVYDIASGKYRLMKKYSIPFVSAMKKALREGDYQNAFRALVTDTGDEAVLCVTALADYIIYGYKTAGQITAELSGADTAMAYGFNWCPPFAMVKALSSVTDMRTLLRQRSSYPGVLTDGDIDRIMDAASVASIDYRQYFKSTE